MNNRFKTIRIKNNLSQEEFGKRIGIESRAHISALENGNRNITDRIIRDVCREFGINEAWLRYGSEPMYKEKDGIFAEVLSEIEESDDEFIKTLISIYWELDEDSKKALRKIAEGLAKKYRE